MRVPVVFILTLTILGLSSGNASEIPSPRSYVFFTPDFTDHSCVLGLSGLYLSDDLPDREVDSPMRTIFVRPDTSGVWIQEFMKNSTMTEEGRAHYWLDSTPAVHLELGRRLETKSAVWISHETFCDGPDRIVDLAVRTNLGNRGKLEEALGQPSTRVEYHVYERINIGNASFIRDELGWEMIYHTAKSPYYSKRGYGDPIDLGKLKEELAARRATFATFRQEETELSHGRLDIVPTENKNAPFIVSFDKPIPNFSISTYGAISHLRRLWRKNATSKDFDDRKAEVEELIMNLNHGN